MKKDGRPKNTDKAQHTVTCNNVDKDDNTN